MKLLKLFVPLFLTLLLMGCSNDDDSVIEDGGKTYFNPPAWIQGRWMYKNGAPERDIIFTKNNVNDLELNLNWNERINLYNLENPDKKRYVEEVITDGYYRYEIFRTGETNGVFLDCYYVSKDVVRFGENTYMYRRN
ncbi:hypothetical protein OBK30_13550 [Empedobacter falsenii]